MILSNKVVAGGKRRVRTTLAASHNAPATTDLIGKPKTMTSKFDYTNEDQIRMQVLTLHGLNLLMREVLRLPLPMPPISRASIAAWSEDVHDFLAKVTKQPSSVFDMPLDDRGLKHQELGELLRDEALKIKDPPPDGPQ